MPAIDLAQVGELAAEFSLEVMGGFNSDGQDGLPDGAKSLVLFGPTGPGFWDYFRTQPEATDGQIDPIDRWSSRAIGNVADAVGGVPLFPFGQTPPLPFVSWALRSGHTFISDAHLLINAKAGLWVSYRGAIALPDQLDFPPPVENPCTTCVQKPCLTACPVLALDVSGYDISKCHEFLDSADGEDCMARGCAVRRACPVSQNYGRAPAQSAHHMRYFHR